MALSGFQALVQSDLSQVVLNPAEAAEPIVYNKAKDGSTRNMNGLVERGVPKEVLAARDAFKSQPRDENRNEYNSTYFALGVAFNERYPEGAATPGAFEWYRRGLIAPEEE